MGQQGKPEAIASFLVLRTWVDQAVEMGKIISRHNTATARSRSESWAPGHTPTEAEWRVGHYRGILQSVNKARLLLSKDEERVWGANAEEQVMWKENNSYSLWSQSCSVRAEHSVRQPKGNHGNVLSVKWLGSIPREKRPKETNSSDFSFLFVSFLLFTFSCFDPGLPVYWEWSLWLNYASYSRSDEASIGCGDSVRKQRV